MNIWVPKLKIIENRDVIAPPKAQMAGFFRIEGSLPDGRRRVICDWFPNLITDGGLERIGSASTFNWCCVGSNGTPPTNADTSILTPIATSNPLTSQDYSNTVTTTPPYYAYFRCKYRFPPPGSNKNVAEVGVGWTTGGLNLWSRSLLKDAGGNPTVATWLAQETLDVYYECRKYPWLNDATSSVVINGTTHNMLMRIAGITGHDGSYNGPTWQVWGDAQYIDKPNPWQGGTFMPYLYSGAIGSITGWPAGSGIASAVTRNAYVPNAKKITGSAVWGPTTTLTSGALSLSVHGTVDSYQIQFTPAIPKLIDWALTLNLESGTWGRKP